MALVPVVARRAHLAAVQIAMHPPKATVMQVFVPLVLLTRMKSAKPSQDSNVHILLVVLNALPGLLAKHAASINTASGDLLRLANSRRPHSLAHGGGGEAPTGLTTTADATGADVMGAGNGAGVIGEAVIFVRLLPPT
jgi:hypothetical protein